MKEKNTTTESASTVCYEMIEARAHSRIQEWLQDLLEAEVTEFLGRGKSQRREGAPTQDEEFGRALREPGVADVPTAIASPGA